MRVTCYTRCSTDRQEMSIPDQLKLIRAHCEKKGYQLLYPETYSDEGLSGTTFEKRKGVMALIANVQNKKQDFKKVIILNESRWGRAEDEDDSTYFELVLKRAGTPIEYVQSENHDGVVGRITRSIKYSQASDFSKQLGKDVIRGSRNVVEAGFSPGGSTPFGYARMLYDATGKPLQVLPAGEQKALKSQKIRWVLGNPEDVALVQRIFTLAIDHSLKAICQILNKEGLKSPEGGKWEVTSLYYMLKNRAYIGERSYGGSKFSRRLHEKVICPLAHEPIIDRQLFNETQEGMAKRSFEKKARYQKSIYLLTSKLECLNCGYNFFGKTMKSKGHINRYYQCNGYEAHRACTSYLIRMEPIEEFVIKSIQQLVASEEYKACLLEFIKNEDGEESGAKATIKAFRGELRKLDREIEKIQDQLLEIPSKSLRARLMDREKKREAIEQKIEAAAQIPKSKAIRGTIEEYFALIENAGRDIATVPPEDRKTLVSYFLEKGEVDRERREVRFYFFLLPAAKTTAFPLHAARYGGAERI